MADRNDIYLRQGLADNGSVYITNGQTATGPFVAIISLGNTLDGDITGTTITSMSGNVLNSSGTALTSIFLPTGFVLTGIFSSVTVDSNTTDRLVCMLPPKDTQ